jgi:uncharacterized protein YceK
MISRLLFVVLPAGVGLLCCGCGTATNTLWLTAEEGGRRPYGGVRADLDVIQAQRDSGLRAAIDLPFSVIGDTVTLPYTLAWECGLFTRTYMNYGPRNPEPLPKSDSTGTPAEPARPLPSSP